MRVEFHGWYSPINYEFHGEVKVWSNRLENAPIQRRHLSRNNDVYRRLKPRYLCFLNNPTEGACFGFTTMLVSEWEAEQHRRGGDTTLRYIFLAYTAEQFDEEDMQDLHSIGERAARLSQCNAFWCGGSCMPLPQELENDVRAILRILPEARHTH